MNSYLLKYFFNSFIIGVIFILGLVNVVNVFASEQNFIQLEALTIGTTLTEDIKSLGKKYTGAGTNEDRNIYLFDSNESAHPHIVETNKENVMTFIQLTIPKEALSSYKLYKASLGTGEFISEKTKSDIIEAYPARGIAFVINGYSNEIMRVKKFPPKTAEEFVKNEGKNFQPVPYVPELRATISSELENAKINRNMWLFPAVIVSLLIGFITIVILRRRKRVLPPQI